MVKLDPLRIPLGAMLFEISFLGPKSYKSGNSPKTPYCVPQTVKSGTSRSMYNRPQTGQYTCNTGYPVQYTGNPVNPDTWNLKRGHDVSALF